MNRWRGVKAPWKLGTWLDMAVTPGFDADDPADVTLAFAEAGITLVPPQDQVLAEGNAGMLILGVYGGTAGFDIDEDNYGYDVGGQIDRLCNHQVIDLINPSDALSERLVVKGMRMSNLQPWEWPGKQVSRAILEPIAAPECFDDFECDRLSVCYTGKCVAGECVQQMRLFGDGNEDGIVSVFDLLQMLGIISAGGDTEDMTVEQGDIDPCAGNGVVSVLDILAALGTFSGTDPCCGKFVPFACCDGDTCTELQQAACDTAGGYIVAGVSSCTPNPCPVVFPAPAATGSFEMVSARSTDRGTAPIEIKLVPSERRAQPGDTVNVDVFATNANDVRGWDIKAALSGGRGDGLELVSTSFDENRRDALTAGVETLSAINQAGGRLVVVALDGSVSSAGTAYLGTFTVRLPHNGAGTYQVDLATGMEQLVVAGSDRTVYSVNVTPATIRAATPERGR